MANRILEELLRFDFGRFYRRVKRQTNMTSDTLPGGWQQFLAKTYRHYERLPSEPKLSFNRAAQFFLANARITGIETDATDDLRVLVASSAVTLSFGWPGYEWRQLTEVLLYPVTFDRDFNFGGRDCAGMVDRWGTVILSVPALLHSFRHPDDPYHVGLHEFAHLLDLGRSRPNGIPPGLTLPQTRQWVEIQRTEMEDLRTGRSILEPYGMSSEVEFFAVSVETFFQTPVAMQSRHPSLYSFLSEYFGQDPACWERAMATIVD